MKLSIILVLLGLSLSLSCNAQWQPTNGPYGGSVIDILKIDSYLFLNGGAGGIYRSADNGDHWTPINAGLPGYPHCYALAATGNTLYAAIVYNGIYKSTDRGTTWTPTGNELQGKTFYSLLADGNDLYAGLSEGGLYYSANGGATWVKRESNLGQIRSFLVAGGSLFAASSVAGTTNVFKSTDKGLNFVNLNAPVTSINFMTGYDNVIYVAGGQPLAISRDYGATWTTDNIGTTGPFTLASMYAHDDRVIIPGGNSTIFISEDEGMHWQTLTTVPNPGWMSAVYSEGDKIILGSSEGILVSDDKAQSWDQKNEGLNNLIITQLKVTDDIQFAASAAGIFTSTDNGLTWANRTDGLKSNAALGYSQSLSVEGMHITPAYAVVANAKGIFKSVDSGLHWNLKQGLQGSDINNRFQVLAGDKDKIFAAEKDLQHYSVTGGQTWTTKTHPAFSNLGIHNAILKGDSIVVLTTENILVSKDFGNTWSTTRVIPGFVFATDALFIADKLYVATYQGLFATSDFTTWTRLATIPAPSVISLTSSGNTLYAGTNKGVYVSYDAGAKWYPLTVGVEYTYPAPLALNSTYAFAGTYGMSVWRSLRTDLNVCPVITAAVIPLAFTQDENIVINLEDLEIDDPDNVFPNDFTLTIEDGDHYSVSGNTIIPDPKYSGELKVKVRVSDGKLESTAYTVSVTLVTGIEETHDGFDLYPNPTTQELNFTMNGEVKSYVITDLAGRKMMHNENLQLNGALHTIDVSGLPAGLYFIEVHGSNNQHRRFLKR